MYLCHEPTRSSFISLAPSFRFSPNEKCNKTKNFCDFWEMFWLVVVGSVHCFYFLERRIDTKLWDWLRKSVEFLTTPQEFCVLRFLETKPLLNAFYTVIITFLFFLWNSAVIINTQSLQKVPASQIKNILIHKRSYILSLLIEKSSSRWSYTSRV